MYLVPILFHLFQSTLPREERPKRIFPGGKRNEHFNPRSHERSDALNICLISLLCISIHAPTRGATCFLFSDTNYSGISIHAPTRGATYDTLAVVDNLKFQSTLPREERQLCTKQLFSEELFQSTLPREERQDIDDMRDYLIWISIHAPTRGATA